MSVFPDVKAYIINIDVFEFSVIVFFIFFFFFSSRRRHTRLQGDWSSDVCSSDLLLSFGGVQGEYTGVRLEPDGRYRLILQDRSTQGALQIFEGLEPGPPMSSLAGYDPRVRPWYQPAIHKDGPHWSPIYTVTGDRGDTTISASTSVRVSGQLAGVVAADVRLSSMNRFLRDEPLRGNGHIAVVDAQGYMVAHSSELSVLKRREGPYDPPVRLRLSESPDLALRSLAALLPAHLSADSSAPAGPEKTINLSFKEQGQIYHGQVTAFHDARGIDWRILVQIGRASCRERV